MFLVVYYTKPIQYKDFNFIIKIIQFSEEALRNAGLFFFGIFPFVDFILLNFKHQGDIDLNKGMFCGGNKGRN